MAGNWLRFAEFAVWVVVVACAGIIVLAIPSFAFGDGLLTLKAALFVVGFLLFGVASLGLQPKRPHRDRKLVSAESDSEFGFEERIQDVPPFRDRSLPLDARVSRNVKLFVVSLLLLAVSLLLEVGFGVAR